MCRLLRCSNINIVRDDVEFIDNQIEINQEVKEQKAKEAKGDMLKSNDLFRLEAEKRAASQDPHSQGATQVG